MTPEEAQWAMKEDAVKIKAIGLGKGFKEVNIFKVDPTEKCPWGRGSLKYVDYEDKKHRIVSCCLTQIDLFHEEKPDRNRRRKQRNRRSVSSTTQSSKENTAAKESKRKRKAKTTEQNKTRSRTRSKTETTKRKRNK